MNSLKAFMAHLGNLDIKIRVKDGQLRLNAPKGALTQNLLAQIKTRKQAIIDVLNTVSPADDSTGQFISKVSREGALSLSFAQQRMWFLGQLEGEAAAYNIPIPVRFEGPLDNDSLERGLAAVVNRHEVLRTRFYSRKGEPYQVISKPGSQVLNFTDLSHLPEQCQEPVVQHLVTTLAQYPFNLEGDCLWHGHLVRLAPQVHLLLFTMHHMISDGWSVAILTDELMTCYRNFVLGRDQPLKPLPFQYADFASWQRKRLSGQRLDDLIGYWRSRLAGASDLLQLATDKPRPRIQGFRGGVVTWTLADAATMHRLQAINTRYGTTMFMTLLSAFALLLSRYSNQHDILLGTPIAGRNRAELESLIGFFINTLIIRTDLTGDPTFASLLNAVREETLGAYTNQELPFEKLVEELKPDRSLAHPPLFQVMFQILNIPNRNEVRSGLAIAAVENEHPTAKFDLNLSATELPERLEAAMEYNSELFHGDTIRRWGAHFRNLLEAIAKNPEKTLSNYSLFKSEERQALLEQWNQTQLDHPFQGCFSKLFEAKAAQHTDGVAAVFGNRHITYGVLLGRSTHMAARFREWGVGSETPVAVLANRDIEFLTCIVALMRAGATYLPLDPAYPEERLQLVLGLSKARFLITSKAFLDLSKRTCATMAKDRRPGICCWETSSITPISDGVLPKTCDIPESQLAYIIFTSGSTGTPNGAMVNHGGMLNHLYAKVHDLNMKPTDTLAQNASQCFDISVWQFLAPLLTGGVVQIFDNEIARDPMQLIQRCTARAVTILEVVPSLLGLMLEDGERRPARPLSSLRWLIPTGEALPPGFAARWLHQYPNIPLVNAYGPTECSDDVTHYTVTTPPDETTVNMPIGRPVINTKIHILDQRLEPVPMRVAGEVFVSGWGVGRGYLRNAVRTAQRFIPNPHDKCGGTRLYKTGDLGCYLPDGNIEYLGRTDNQVKLRGFRIELGEIESVLGRLEPVREAAVLVRNTEASEQLVAYVSAPSIADDNSAASATLTTLLKEQLPDYMIPASYVFLKRLPLSPNGKVDRVTLAKMDLPKLDVAQVDYRTPEEELLGGIWSEVLGRERIGVHEDFFDLGGHSLLLFKVMARIRATFAVELPLPTLFTNPQIATLAESIRQARQARGPENITPISPVARDRNLPLSFAQQRLWVLDRLEGPGSTYNLPLSFRLGGHIDIAILERSLNALIDRHEGLRTSFPAEEGLAKQRILPSLNLSLAVVDLSNIDNPQQVENLVTAEVRRPFFLAEGPLIRAMLIRAGASDHILTFTLHHIISDGWSNDLLNREWTTLYQALLRSRSIPLAPLPIQYADYAIWQRQWLQGEVLEKQQSYWQSHLAGAPAMLTLPTDRPRPAVQGFQGGTTPLTIDRETTNTLKSLSRQTQVTSFMALLGAYGALLSIYSGQTDVVIGSPVANRGRKELEGLIGFFVNNLCLRMNLEGNPSYRQLLEQARTITLGAYDHQDLPFEKLVDQLQPERNLSHSPLFQAMLVFENDTPGQTGLPGLDLEPVSWEHDSAKFDLAFHLKESPQGMRGAIEYRSDLFHSETAQRMSVHFQTLLSKWVAQPDTPLGELDLLTPQQRQAIMVSWQSVPSRSGQVTHRRVEKIAERQPHAVAIIQGQRYLSYGLLNRRANQLARYLDKHLEATPGGIGIYLDRSPEAVIAMLAALKSSRFYLHLDPAYPAQRLHGMASDSKLAAVVTDQDHSPRAPLGCVSLCLTREAGAIATQKGTNLQFWVDPKNAAYQIYTSGSTGKPKGVVISHQGLAHLIAWHQQQFDITHRDRASQMAAPAFDASVWELWPYLATGSVVDLVPKNSLAEPMALRDFLVRRHISVGFLPTPLVEDLLGMKWPNSRGPRWVLTGGDALHHHPPRGLPFQLVNNYGPTENTVVTTSGPVPLRRKGQGLPALGKPLIHAPVVIMNHWAHPLPPGIPGEIFIGGPALARGYRAEPSLTAQKFIPNPLATEPGDRLYRSGDRARFLANGDLQFLGRIDHQVKIRGFRIELGEIEATLTQHPKVAASAVTLTQVKGTSGPKRLVAYLVLTPQGEDLNGKSIRFERSSENGIPLPAEETAQMQQYTKDTLPEYMIPSLFITLNALPTTTTGKLNRKALPTADVSLLASSETYTAPRTTTEKILSRIWADQLGVEKVGIHDNFFDTGGDSILSIRVTAKIRQAGYAIKPRQLFESQTIAELASQIAPAQLPAKDVMVVTGKAPLIPIQTYFFSRNLPQAEYLTVGQLFQAPGTTDPALLEGALGEVLAHHDGLRTRFMKTKGTWYQFFSDPTDAATLSILDLGEVPETQRGQAVTKAAIQIQNSLRLQEGPVVRLALFHMGTNQDGSANPVRILLVAHHLVMDGFSLPLVIEDLQSVYFQLFTKKSLDLPSKSTSCKDWALGLAQYSQTAQATAELDYWTAPKNFTTPPLPIHLAADKQTNTRGSVASISIQLDEHLTQAVLQDLARAHKLPMDAVLMTALVMAFHQWAQVHAIRVDLVGHGRQALIEGLDPSRTVGCLATIFPLYLALDPDAGPLNTLFRVSQQLERLPNKGIGFGVLRFASPNKQMRAAMEALPQAEIHFNYVGQGGRKTPRAPIFGPAPEPINREHNHDVVRPWLFNIHGATLDGRMHLNWQYSTNLYPRHQVQRLTQCYLNAMNRLANLTTPEKSTETSQATGRGYGLQADDRETVGSTTSRSTRD